MATETNAAKSFGIYTLITAAGGAFTWIMTNISTLTGNEYAWVAQVVLGAFASLGVGAYIERVKKANEVVTKVTKK